MAESDTSFTVVLDGEKVDVDPLDIDGNEWHAVKQQTGLPAKQVLDGADDFDFDCLAAVVWVHVRRTNPSVELDEVRSGLTLRSLMDGKPGVDADPSPSEDDSGGDSES